MERDSHEWPPLRALRRALVVSDMRHLTHAAHALRRSQSAITRDVVRLEQFLGVQLFERTVTGMVPTRAGEVLFERLRRAVDHLARAEVEVLADSAARLRDRPKAHSLLRLEISNASLFGFLSLCDTRDIRATAARSGIAVSTARRSIRELEQQMGTRLFDREPHGGVRPTPTAETLARYVKRALWEIRAGLDELAEGEGRVAGSVRIGVMSTARSVVVPRAVDRLHKRYPDVVVNVYWANYADLKSALSCGDIDFIIGTLRGEELALPDHDTITIAQDEIVIAARAAHPLARRKSIELSDLINLDWIMPPSHFQLRTWFRAELARRHLAEPRPFIETASLAILRGSLLESDCVALSTRLQCWHDIVQHGLLTALRVTDLLPRQGASPFHLHLTKRAGVKLSPAANALFSMVADVAADIDSGDVSGDKRTGLRVIS